MLLLSMKYNSACVGDFNKSQISKEVHEGSKMTPGDTAIIIGANIEPLDTM